MVSCQIWNHKKKSLEKVHLTNIIGLNLNFLDLQLSKLTYVGVAAKNKAAASLTIIRKFKL